MEIEVAVGRAVHSLFMCAKKESQGKVSCTFFEQMNNQRTVTRLGVDKFTSSLVVANTIATACELANTLRLEAKEEEYYLSPLLGKGGDISTLEKRVTFLFWVDREICTRQECPI